MKKKKNLTAVYILIAVVVLSLAVIFLLPSLSKEGYAIKPTVSEKNDFSASLSSDTIFYSDDNSRYYIYRTSFNAYTNSNGFISGFIYPNVNGYHSYSNARTYRHGDKRFMGTSNTVYANEQNVQNPYVRYIYENENYFRYDRSFNLNNSEYVVANYYEFSLDPLTNKITFKGELYPEAMPILRLYLSVNNSNNEFLFANYIDIPQKAGVFEHTLDLYSLFPNKLENGTYTAYLSVHADYKKSTPELVELLHTSSARRVVQFEYNNNKLFSSSNLSKEESMAKEDFLKKDSVEDFSKNIR